MTRMLLVPIKTIIVDMTKFIALAACALGMPAWIGATAQQTQMLTGDKNNEYGVVYSLPRTELVVDVRCRVTERVPGPYRQYAKRYLGADAEVAEHSAGVQLCAVDMWVRGVPSDRQYLMQMKPGALARLNVAGSGMLLAINTTAEPEDYPAPEQVENAPEPDMDEYLRYVDSDYLTSLSSAKRAQLLAQTIMDIRESRLSLSRGTAETMPADGRQLELMLQSLEQQENALTRAFNGYEYTREQARRFTLLPDSTSLDGDILLFRLSDNDGFCDKDDYSGEPVYINLAMVQSPEVPLDAKGEPKELPKNAVIYALPGTLSVALKYKGEPAGNTEELDFAQFGMTFGLDPKLFTDKRKPSMATFDPATGALKSISEIQQ